MAARVLRMVAHLRPRQQRAFLLRYVENTPVHAAARAARCTDKALRRRAERALAELRRALSACQRCALGGADGRQCPAAAGKIACLKYSIIQHLESDTSE